MTEPTFLDVFHAIWPVIGLLFTFFGGLVVWQFKVQRKHTVTCMLVKSHADILNHDKLMAWARDDQDRTGRVRQLRKDHDELKATVKEDRDRQSKTDSRIWKAVEDLQKFKAHPNGKANRS